MFIHMGCALLARRFNLLETFVVQMYGHINTLFVSI